MNNNPPLFVLHTHPLTPPVTCSPTLVYPIALEFRSPLGATNHVGFKAGRRLPSIKRKKCRIAKTNRPTWPYAFPSKRSRDFARHGTPKRRRYGVSNLPCTMPLRDVEAEPVWKPL